MGILSTTSTTVQSVLNSVASAADMTQRTINGASQSVELLEAYIALARKKQIDAHLIELDTYRTTLIDESTASEQRRQASLAREFSDPATRAHYDAIHARLSALFEPRP